MSTASKTWIAPPYRETLKCAGLAGFDEIMGAETGRCLRVLPDRENWYLDGSRHSPCAVSASSRHTPCAVRPAAPAAGSSESERLGARGAGPVHVTFSSSLKSQDSSLNEADGTRSVPAPLGVYLKKHRACSWLTRIAAAVGAGFPRSPGRVEAENALALQSLGIDVMPLMAWGEKLHADGRLESFLLSEELQGYCELQDFIERRFPTRFKPSPSLSPATALCDERGRSPARQAGPALLASPATALSRLIVQVATIARRFHAAGFNHRDFYCCHFLTKETSPGRFDVRLIDLQRVQRRRWLRRRWIVKDLAQLASMSPDGQVGCREKIFFLRAYLGVRKLRPQDKRLVRDVLGKLARIRRRTRRKS